MLHGAAIFTYMFYVILLEQKMVNIPYMEHMGNGTSQLQMDANWGYPHFRKPPYLLDCVKNYLRNGKATPYGFGFTTQQLNLPQTISQEPRGNDSMMLKSVRPLFGSWAIGP